jgi:signal transduction histidine kinase
MPPPSSSALDLLPPHNQMGTAPSPDDVNLQKLLSENARLKEELQFSREKAASLKRELEEFVYAAGHDLKTYLRNIGSYSQLLTRGGTDAESSAAYAHFILDGVRSALTFIEQLVLLSKAGSSPSRSTVNLASSVQTALYKLQPEVARTGAQVTQHDLPQVSVNQSDFEQVFERLIDNAIKYSGPNKPVIEISGEETDDGFLISIRDNGPGIPEKFLNTVFQPFKRLHGSEIPGAGVGLAVCRKIVEAHDGRLWVESDGKNGSTFKIRLPY